MSCFVTQAAVRNRTKTVTRRKVSTWANAKAGDRILLIEKGQGLKKGQKQVVLAEVELVDVRVESAEKEYGNDEAAREGFPELDADGFVASYCAPRKPDPSRIVTRIELAVAP